MEKFEDGFSITVTGGSVSPPPFRCSIFLLVYVTHQHVSLFKQNILPIASSNKEDYIY